MKVKVKANAKINIGLKVIAKEENGYHRLDMVNALIDLYDDILFKDHDDIVVRMDRDCCEEQDNLCYKIAKYLQKEYNINSGIYIKIKKRIPIKAGLGGGSSDAAQTILFLNEHWGLNMSLDEMIAVGAKYGSDIPFFIVNRNARIKGYGEKVEPLNCPLNNDIILLIPNFDCSTKEIFKNFKEYTNKSLDLLIEKMPNNFCNYVFNDLMGTVNKLNGNKIDEIIKECENLGIKYCCMSGAGSAIVCYSSNINRDYKQIKKHFKDLKIIKTKIKNTSY